MPASPVFPSKIVVCPGCGGDSVYGPTNIYRPFCGERCKNHDLGAWANEEFRVQAKPDLDPDADFEDAAAERPH
jgi:endogenous inhibitor of DNA gyrase (YacG/DUF329 family)